MESVVDFARVDTETGGSRRTSDKSTRTDERLTLRNVGAYLYDPGLVTLTIGGTFGLSQEWFETESDSASREGTREGTLWGYETFASILPGQAISLNLFAKRSQDFLSRELAGRSEVRSEDRGATLVARRLYIPSWLTFRQEFREEESRTADIVTRFEEREDIITYEGRRGWIDSEMNLRYEFIDHVDEIFPGLDFQSHEGNAYYSRDFGTELNRRWNSRLRYFTRGGASNLTTWDVDELLRIDHSERLQTQYRYELTISETDAGTTTTHTGIFTLRHQLYESLTTTLTLDPTFQRLPGGEKDIYRGRVDLDYTKRLPGQGRLNVGLGGGFAYEDDRFDTTETAAVNELHTAATPFTLPIALDNPFVIQSSVVVTKVALGPLPAGCAAFGVPRTLTEGVDYTLRTVGDTTEIVPIPCSLTTPGINPGDTIAVDYRSTVSPSLTFTTITGRADVSVDYRWIRPFFVHEQREQTLLSGRDGRFLDDQMSDTIGVELRYDQRRLQARLVAEAESFTSGRLAFDEVRLNQSLTFAILPKLTLTLSGHEAFTDFSDPERRETGTLRGRATLTCTLNASLFAETFAEIRDFTDTLVEDERTIESGLRVRWIFRKLEIRPTLEFTDLRRGDTDTKEYRAILKIIRRF